MVWFGGELCLLLFLLVGDSLKDFTSLDGLFPPKKGGGWMGGWVEPQALSVLRCGEGWAQIWVTNWARKFTIQLSHWLVASHDTFLHRKKYIMTFLTTQ